MSAAEQAPPAGAAPVAASSQPGGENTGTAGGAATAPEHTYFEDLPGGIIVTEEMRPVMDGFAGAMHKIGAPKEVVHQALDWHQQHVAAERAEVERFDSETMAETVATMTEKWGQQGFEQNVGAMRGFLKKLPPGVGDAIANARMEDGRPLMNTPAGLEWLLGLAGGAGRAPAKVQASAAPATRPAAGAADPGVDAEIAKIENAMRANRAAYNRDEVMQARYRELLMQKHGGSNA